MKRDCLELAQNLACLKRDLVRTYVGRDQICEPVPVSPSDAFPMEQKHLELLHKFAEANPIYRNSYKDTLAGIHCIVYEGDVNRYWLSSIQHSTSCAPFSPTWIMSAYVVALLAKNLGYSEAVDVGSGDGRVAFCARLLGMESHSIEVDETLVFLQRDLAFVDFDPWCSDAISFDYSQLGLVRPALFIGGLAQMGGTTLSSGVLKRIRDLSVDAGWVFTGTLSPKYTPDPSGYAGWGTLMGQNGLCHTRTLLLPTTWTLCEPEDTPYVFTQRCE